MSFDLAKASHRLSELELNFTMDNFNIEVVWFRVFAPNGDWNISRHKHSTYEFHFIAKGTCLVKLDSSEFEVSEGEFYLTAPGVFHEQMVSGTNGLIEYSLNCDINLVKDSKSQEAWHILQLLHNTPCKLFKDTTGILDMFNSALEEAYYQKIGFLNNIKSHIILMITMATRAIEGNTQADYKIPLKSKKEEIRFEQIKKYIEDNISCPISTGDIAGFMYLSEKQISRIIKQVKSISTKELIMQIKLQKAKELLKDSNVSISEISDMLGFSSEYYFNQFFKREEGSPPGIFRSNFKNV